MDSIITSLATSFHMKDVNNDQTLFVEAGFRHKEFVSVAYDENSKVYTVRHYAGFPGGREADFKKETTTDAKSAYDLIIQFICEMKTAASKECKKEIAGSNDICEIGCRVQDMLEEALCLWESPSCATHEIGEARAEVLRALRKALDANENIIHESYTFDKDEFPVHIVG